MLTRMPIIHMKLIESKKKATKGIYNCPCYVYPDRQGSRDKPSYVMSFDLKVTSSTTCFGSPSLTLHLTGREARIGILAETRSRSAVVLHRRLLANLRVHYMKNCCVYCKLADIQKLTVSTIGDWVATERRCGDRHWLWNTRSRPIQDQTCTYASLEKIDDNILRERK